MATMYVGPIEDISAALDSFMALTKKCGLGKSSREANACLKAKVAIATIADAEADKSTLDEPTPEKTVAKKTKAKRWPKKKKKEEGE